MNRFRRRSRSVFRLLPLAAPLLAAALLGGCMILQKPSTPAVESMLLSSGFKMKTADTPQKLAALDARPQRKVIPLQRKGTLYYGYTDAKGCKCAYLGDAAAYTEFRSLMAENKMVEQSQKGPEATMPVDVIVVEDDDEWGAWGGVVIGE